MSVQTRSELALDTQAADPLIRAGTTAAYVDLLYATVLGRPADPAWVRPTFRFHDVPSKRGYGIGFRCARSP